MATQAHAQRATVNLVTEAEDAFGLSTVDEAIGLYDSRHVRGLSPRRAGNLRLEGLYYDGQGLFTEEAIASSGIKVGLSAASYPFASPSGIVDNHLQHAQDNARSASMSFGSAGDRSLSADAAWHSPQQRLSARLAFADAHDADAQGGGGRSGAWGAVIDLRPRPSVEATLFANRQHYWQSSTSPLFFSSGAALPDNMRRGVRLTQNWARERGDNRNAGALLKLDLPRGWTWRTGVFLSQWRPRQSFDTFVFDADLPGQTTQQLFASRDGAYGSISGETRLVHDGLRGGIRYRNTWSLRGRTVDRRYGGDLALDLGPTLPGVRTPVAPPAVFDYGPQDRERGRQHVLGWHNQTQWTSRIASSLALQRVDTRSRLLRAGAGTTQQHDADTLASAGITVRLNDRTLLFSAYSEGSESLGVAPTNATNANQLLDSIISTQREAGLRYSRGERLSLQVNAFDLRRPYAGFDDTGRYRNVGLLQNRGIEISYSGQPTERLTLLGGMLWMDARVQRNSQGSHLSQRPVGIAGRQAMLYADYALPVKTKITLDGSIVHRGPALVDARTGLQNTGDTVVSVGGRLQVGDAHRTTLRLGIDNLFDRYAWDVDAAGSMRYTAPRTIALSLHQTF